MLEKIQFKPIRCKVLVENHCNLNLLMKNF